MRLVPILTFVLSLGPAIASAQSTYFSDIDFLSQVTSPTTFTFEGVVGDSNWQDQGASYVLAPGITASGSLLRLYGLNVLGSPSAFLDEDVLGGTLTLTFEAGVTAAGFNIGDAYVTDGSPGNFDIRLFDATSGGNELTSVSSFSAAEVDDGFGAYAGFVDYGVVHRIEIDGLGFDVPAIDNLSVAVVPEPAHYALALSACGLGLVMWRRRRAAA
jgi:hypothetical protein